MSAKTRVWHPTFPTVSAEVADPEPWHEQGWRLTPASQVDDKTDTDNEPETEDTTDTDDQEDA